ncbi:MAG: YceD family protein [Bacteroidales bacterium]|nr:YceD family protein [Bacteroidales bacterium]
MKTNPEKTQFTVSGDFFDLFGQKEFLDADLRLTVLLGRENGGFALKMDFDGRLVLRCDRCMEEMDWPVSFSSEYALRRQTEGGSEDEDETEDGREIIRMEPSAKFFDLSQLVYDELCLHIPIRHAHPEGGCNPQALKYLTDKPGGEGQMMDTPFAGLKDLQL